MCELPSDSFVNWWGDSIMDETGRVPQMQNEQEFVPTHEILFRRLLHFGVLRRKG